MSNDEYVGSIIKKYALLTAPTPAGAAAAQAVFPLIQQWAGKYLLKVSYSGSTAKGTAISGITDLDLFISLSNDTPENLSEIYQKLATHFEAKGYKVRRQNVSIGITHNGVSMDLVPARKHVGKESRLNLGCVLKAGSFELVDCETGESKVRLFPREEALIQFFLAFLAKLQKVGSVPAMDIRAYAGRIGTGKES